MRITGAFLFMALSLWAVLPAVAKSPVQTLVGIVTKVSDGDTVQVTDSLGTKVRVRLYGIDAPETEKSNRRTGRVSKGGQPYGSEAKDALAAKIERQTVRVDVMDVDRYRRLVGIVKLGNRDINAEMIREGWAWAYRSYLDRPHASIYLPLEDEARNARRGLWQQTNQQPPWEFRRLQRMR